MRMKGNNIWKLGVPILSYNRGFGGGWECGRRELFFFCRLDFKENTCREIRKVEGNERFEVKKNNIWFFSSTSLFWMRKWFDCILKDLWPVHFFRDVLLPWLCRCLVTTMLYRITEFFPVLRENLLFLSLLFLLAQPLHICGVLFCFYKTPACTRWYRRL